MTENKVRFAQLSFWFGHASGICAAAERADAEQRQVAIVEIDGR